MKINKDVLLSDIVWYRIGGRASYLLEVSSKEDLLEAFAYIKQNNIARFLVIGSGSNLLISDAPFDGAVIHCTTSGGASGMQLDSNMLICFAGADVDDVMQFAFAHNLAGLEWAGGLPGTIGGAVRGNAGAFGHEMQEIVVSAEVLDPASGQTHRLSHEKFAFSYRSSSVKIQNLILLSVVLQLHPAAAQDLDSAKQIYRANISHRQTHNPLEYPSCGSTFKNITDPQDVARVLTIFPDLKEQVVTKWHGKVSMGHLIALLGFSGHTQGHATVSEKHANYILNLGGARFADVYGIIEAIKEKFFQTFGFSSETEVEIVGS